MQNRIDSPRIALLLTGNELVSGEITDTNSVFMARELSAAGVVVSRKMVVGDQVSSLTDALVSLSEGNDVVIVNGGMGSTVDDLTAEVAAFVSGNRLIESPAAIEHISKRFGREILAEKSRFYTQLKKQALIPESADLLDNPVGLALGFKLTINDAICYFTPGVPSELKEMFRQSILPDIQRLFTLRTGYKTSRLNVVGIGESHVQQLINQHVSKEALQEIQLGFRANMSFVELKLTIDSPDSEPVLSEVLDCIRSVLSDYIFSEVTSLPEAIIDLLRQAKRRVVVAESCTGGLIASQITAVPGASDVFEAGIVTYSNRSKNRLLGVSKKDLETFGAVSREIAISMVEGALEKTGADVAVAVTGIAGPTGGSPEKPVGTVYIGWGKPGDIHIRLMQVKRERAVFQQLVSSAVMDILRRYLQGLKTDSIYYFDEISREQLRLGERKATP